MKDNSKKRFAGFATAALLFCVCAWANPVTPEQAMQSALRFMEDRRSAEQSAGGAGQKMPRKNLANSEWKAAAVFDALDRHGMPYLYAVQAAEQGGFVLVSGDDRFAEVLGYSDSRLFDEHDMPDNMRAWLQGYIDEMRYLDSVGYQSSVVSDQSLAVSDQKEPIAPLIATTWNQDAPFNELCPLDNNNKRSVTGCVATAMAQVVNYHMQHYNAPTTVIADIPAYTTKSHSLSVNAVPAGTSLPDRSLLLNAYGTNATTAQKNAVAQLMLYCGTAVQMNYTSNSSSASSSNVPYALVNYFGFDATVSYENRSAYTYAGWQEAVYSELAAARPVYYRGSSSGSGHAFIVDGYDGNGLFHINWGWGGDSNDYFALSVLNPDDDGLIGASPSSDGYTNGQAALFGVQINTGKTITRPVCLSVKNLRAEGDQAVFAAYNHTGETHTFNSGIGFIDASGNITKIQSKKHTDLQDGYGYSALRFTVPADGNYALQTKKIVPISRQYTVQGTEPWYTGANPDIYYFIAQYDADGVPTLTAHPDVRLRVDTIYVPTSRYMGETQSVKLSVTNTGDEYYGSLYLFASLADTLGEAKAELGLTALENSTQTISFEWKPAETGTYTLWVATDEDGVNQLASSSVTIREDASLQGKTVAIVDYKFDNQDRSTFQVDEATGIRSMDVYGSQLKGKVKVKNMTDEQLSNYQVKVLVEKYNEQTGSYITGTSSTYFILNLSPGYTINLNIDRALETDNTYRICVVLRNSPSTYLDDRYVVHMRSSKPMETAVETPVTPHPSPLTRKVLRDGRLLILRDEHEYTIQGQLIR